MLALTSTPYSRLQLRAICFLTALFYILLSATIVYSQSSVNAQTAAQLAYMQYGTASGFSVTAAGTAVTINLTPGGNQTINDAVGGAAVVIGAAGTQVISTTAAGFNNLWTQAVQNKCAISPSASVCSSTGQFNYPVDTYVVGIVESGGARSIDSLVTSSFTGTLPVATLNGGGNGTWSTYTWSPSTSNLLSTTGWHNKPIVVARAAGSSPSSPLISSSNNSTPEERAAVAAVLSPAAIAAAASISPTIPLPGADVPSVLVTAPPGTSVYTSTGVVTVPASGSVSVPNPNYGLSAQATAAGQSAYDEAKAAGSSDADAEAKRAAAISAYTDAKAAGATDSEATVAAKAAAKATAPTISQPSAVTPITRTTFSSSNFVSYAVDKFSTKFPFDFFNVTVSSSVPECPNYTFFSKTFLLCPVRDFISIFKYPIVIGFAIRSIMSL